MTIRMGLLAVLLGLGVPVFAEDSKVVYVHKPSPRYPEKLKADRVSGAVLIQFKANHDGLITDLKVIDSAHTLFSTALERTMRNWRVERWEVTEERPASVPIRMDFYFIHEREEMGPNTWVRRRLNHVRCSKVNDELRAFSLRSPDEPLTVMKYFRETIRQINHHSHYRKVSVAEATAKVGAFIDAIPPIIDMCSNQPNLRYIDLLPNEVREWL